MPEIVLTLDSSGAIKGLRQYEDEVNKVDKKNSELTGSFDKMRNVLNQVGTVVTFISSVLTGAAVTYGAYAVDMASIMDDTQNKFSTVYKGMEDDAEAWAKVLQDSYIMSVRESKQFLASTEDLLEPMGMAQQKAGEMSFEVAKLAADLASFNPEVRTAEQAMSDMQSALVGNYETMKKYGIALTSNRVEQEAYRLGLAAIGEELTAAQKAEAAFSLIVQGSTNAIGDTVKTNDSYEAQLKRLKANIEDFNTQIGTYLIPYANKAITAFNSWTKSGGGMVTVIDSLISGVMFLYDGFKGLELVLKGIIVGFGYVGEAFYYALTPLNLILEGLEKLNLIDVNPIKELGDAVDDFLDSALEGFQKTWEEVEKGNEKFDALRQELYKLRDTSAETTEAVAEDMKSYERAIADVTEEINKQWQANQEIIVQSDSLIAALKGQKDELTLVDGAWVNMRSDITEYGRIVTSHTAPAEEELKEKVKDTKDEVTSYDDQLKTTTDTQKSFTQSIEETTDAAEEADAALGSIKQKTIEMTNSFTSSGDAVQDLAAKLENLKNLQDLTGATGQYWASGTFSIWNDDAKDRMQQEFADNWNKLIRDFIEGGGSIGDYYDYLQGNYMPESNMSGDETTTTTNNSSVNMFITESVSRSDVSNIANELARNEARA